MRRAGPLVWTGFDGLAPPNDLLERVRDDEVGGIVLFARNVRDAAQTRDLVRAFHDARPIPVAVDQEGGNVVRIGFGTIFPSAMAFGAVGDAELAERAASVVARELRALGVSVLFAPVCDVNVEPRNPVIGTRAFGDDPVLCARLAAAFVRGAQAHGVACVAKHFPGHGATDLDSHIEPPEVADDDATIVMRDVRPFRAAIDAGVAGVMVAHVRYVALADTIATFAPAVVRGLLRTKLRFEGLATSDGLEMGAARVPEGSAAARAIAAGIDVVLAVPTGSSYEPAVDGIERACVTGEIAPARVAEALNRARDFAARHAFAPAEAFPPADHALAREVALRAITHVGPPLPSLSGPVVCAAFASRHAPQVEELRDPLGVLERALRARFGERLTFARDPVESALPRDATTVLVTASAFFDAEQAERARQLAGHRPAVLCAIRSPYDAALFPEIPALLTYSDVPASCEALAAVLAGERAPQGRLPVRLPA